MGAVTVVVWADFLSGGIFDLYEIVPGFILGGLVAILVSLAGQPPKDIAEEFDKVTKM